MEKLNLEVCTMINYKHIEIDDIEDFWSFLNILDLETDYMMYEPGERNRRTALLELESDIQKNVINGEDYIYLAVDDKKIVGYIRAERGKFNRIHHTAYIVVGILKKYRAKGIGTTFFDHLDKWAKENHISRLELSVECPNNAAKNLYEKSGFIVEGIRRNAMYVNEQYIDEYYMAKIL